MNRYVKSAVIVAAMSLVVSVITACMGSASAGNSASGPSQSAFDALQAQVTALATRVTTAEQGLATATAAIESLAKGQNLVSLGGGSSKQGLAKALLDGEVGAYVSYLPADKPIYQATSLQIRTLQGYLFALPAPGGGYPVAATVYYTSADCSGTPYIASADLSAYGRSQGAVFGYGNASNPEAVGYVVPDTTMTTGLMLSRFKDGNCFGGSFDFPVALLSEVLPNDPAVTGVSNEPYPGPITLQQM